MKIYPLARFSSKSKVREPYLIAGLGNPGKRYVDTRHNVGFEMLDALALSLNVRVKKIRFKGLTGEGRIAGQDVVLLKPQTFMNLSGESVREACAFYKIPPQRVIVLYDDAALPVGRVRIRPSGSAGGQNGMKSIIYHLKSEEFARVRIGIGLPPQDGITDYVLSRFSKADTRVLIGIARDIPAIVEVILQEGVAEAMNRYNPKQYE